MTNVPSMRIAPAGEGDFATVASLFRHYAASLPVDLDAQGFADEIAHLPGPYAPPSGALLLARQNYGITGDDVLGCIALKRLAPGAAEIKRLYVAEQGRRLGVGKALVAGILQEAKRLGYREIKLDTLPHMAPAIALYRSFGFVAVAPYGSFPYPGLICFGRPLP
ncbi:MAG TPA: GNAT family N-acetyltransferase [Rhizomicrobium sp.]|nr:GNAT family N-acetyltransferase [Rhizomicrobium sp.]